MEGFGGNWKIYRSLAMIVWSFALASMFVSAERSLKQEGSNLIHNESESNYAVKVANFLWQSNQSGYQHVWPDLEFNWQVVVASIIGFCGAAFGSVGGVGGGGIFVPMLTLIIGFDPKSATAISKCMIMGAAASTVYYNLKLRHPTIDMPIIDYDLALLIQPMLMLGISIGVAFNVLFADWMVTILLIVLFISTSTKAFMKGVDTWKGETILKQEAAKRKEENGNGEEGADYKLLPSGPENGIQNETKKSRKEEVSIIENVYWKELGLLSFVWVAFLAVQITKVLFSPLSTKTFKLNVSSNSKTIDILLPIEICKDLEKQMCKFWWKTSTNKENSIHWKSWKNMCKKKSSGGMGFRNLRDFNVAMIGKQGWRLLNYPDRLVSKVYKARYYPSGSFLNAKLGGNPSYIWRSIMEAQFVLKQGLACNLGSGNQVSILEDPWLPLVDDPYIHSTSEALKGKKVSSLMCIDNKQWDIDLIMDIFDHRDSSLILSIPLTDDDTDTWYWREDKLGHYTVKSAYALMQERKESNHMRDNSGFWRKLWNLKISAKVKHFLWRACSDCLPTKDLLRRRRVDVNGLCPVCNDTSETILHILVECSFAASCIYRVTNQRIYGEFYSFADWVHLVFEQCKGDTIKLIIMTCWMLWKNRNELVWKQRSMDVAEVVNSAISNLNQWQCVQDRTFDRFMGFMTHDDGHEHWQLPKMNSVKINTDAAIFESTKCYSFACVIRNQTGELIEAFSRCLQGNPSPELAEAFGIREALSWVKSQKRTNVEIESDCLQVVQAIRSSFSGLSCLGRVVQECKTLLIDVKNQNVIIRFVKRSANRVAHYLARYSCSVADRRWKENEVHSDFTSVLLNDLRSK